EKRVVWSFYVIGGRIAADVWFAKWAQFRAYVIGSKCLSAYVALSVHAGDVTLAGNAAGELLAVSQDIDSYLCGSTRGPVR
ncbi:MAG TPA: hypothetical protein VMF66_18355, partial [Candidatus Acidoferrum sp.]|nr:hypothetical protein [Candidatus Acidoferrum sp.]